VEALLLDLRLEDAAIAGHSLGGLVALEIALRRRARPPRIALVAAMGLGPAMRAPSRAYFLVGPERLARRLGRALFTRLHGGSGGELGARLDALYHELCAVPGGRPAAAAAFNAMVPATGPVPNRFDRLGEIDTEALVLWGERDEVFPPAVAIAAAAALRRAELRMLPVGHAPQREAPEAVLAMLSAL
jgi:pimeloyl-ACP methyl ester carboxylesterase